MAGPVMDISRKVTKSRFGVELEPIGRYGNINTGLPTDYSLMMHPEKRDSDGSSGFGSNPDIVESSPAYHSSDSETIIVKKDLVENPSLLNIGSLEYPKNMAEADLFREFYPNNLPIQTFPAISNSSNPQDDNGQKSYDILNNSVLNNINESTRGIGFPVTSRFVQLVSGNPGSSLYTNKPQEAHVFTNSMSSIFDKSHSMTSTLSGYDAGMVRNNCAALHTQANQQRLPDSAGTGNRKMFEVVARETESLQATNPFQMSRDADVSNESNSSAPNSNSRGSPSDSSEGGVVANLFLPPGRPNYGQVGTPIKLRANFFKITYPSGLIHLYEVNIIPDKCPRRLNREVIEVLVTKYSDIFGKLRPVYDGRKNLYSRNFLPIPDRGRTFEITLPGNNADRVFIVSLHYQHCVDLSLVDGEFVSGSTVQALDVILRHLASLKFVAVGKSFFLPSSPFEKHRPNDSMTSLGMGREIWFGYHQAVQPSRWQAFLNVDVSATAFYKHQPVISFLREVLELHETTDLKKPLSDVQRVRFAKEIKGLKVEVTHSGPIKRKYRVVDVTKRPAQTLTFPYQTPTGMKDCTVYKYFQDKYNIKLQHPTLPCLQVGQEMKHTYLPLELCNVVEGQKCSKKLSDVQTSIMIRTTSTSAPERQLAISNMMRRTTSMSDPYMKAFEGSVSGEMAEVPGRVLPVPRIQYGGTSRVQVMPTQGVWDMRGKQLYQGITIETWALACFAPQSNVNENALRNFTTQLQKISSEAGMPIDSQPCFCKYATDQGQVLPLISYLKANFPNLQLIIFILPGKTPIYAEVKRVGDVMFGTATQCVQAKNVQKISPQTLSNLCLKINVKLGGVNSILLPNIRPPVFTEPIIFFGADVTHPGAGDKSRPSIAAVVASMDAHPSKYSALVSIQKQRQEIIRELAEMVRTLLCQFYRVTGFKPHRIVFYRDGASEGQFENILNFELRAIREACLKLDLEYQPGISYIIVQKRHHARLFCSNSENCYGKGRNIPAGTTVDSIITNPNDFDFYLCSHAGIQGTSRPSHYRVLWDDNQFRAEELQMLTYQLCHTYVRCTRSVSIPAPAYYAHLVAFRARYHISDSEHENPDGSQESHMDEASIANLMKSVQVHPNSFNVMYFA